MYMEFLAPLEDKNRALVCVGLRCAATSRRENKSDLYMLRKESVRPVAREWFEIVLFQSVLSTVHVTVARFAVHPSTTKLSRTIRRSFCSR